jgi:transposase
VVVTHEALTPGNPCPCCQEGILYRQKDWAQVVRLIGQPPVGGQRYELERLRCGLCGEVQTAPLPKEAGPSKYDPTVASIIALLRYGQGVPWNRIQQLQGWAGIPLPASVQWELVRDAIACGPESVYRQLLWEAAQGDLMHNDDTHMRILELTEKIKNQEPLREDDPDRSGVFTTNILSVAESRPTISLFFTGPRHSGENLHDLLTARVAGLPPPMQMCDALSRNLPGDLKTIVANCLSHARRNFYELKEVFPAETLHVLECFKTVYLIDRRAKQQAFSPQDRLLLHQEQSRPVMKDLQKWLRQQFDERRVEPNSSLGKAIKYMLKHWEKLTLFLHVPGAPLDNNICERALKMSIKHRKNSLFYKTQRGAQVGDIYMSLIHTCQNAQADPFDYLTQLQRHRAGVIESPADWFPWNYRQQPAVSQ